MFLRLIGVVALLLLVGCSDGSGMPDLQTKLDHIRAKPKGRIPPPPEFKAYATFSYSAHTFRSPFRRPIIEEEVIAEVIEGVTVQPDESRVREYLEQFSVEALRMAGTMQKPDSMAPLFVLIEDPDGDTHPVTVGNFIGKNHGEIRSVSEQSITLVEIVPNGHGGWVERPRAISLTE